MLCDMLFRVTWLHIVCGASVRWLVSGGIVPSLYTVSRHVWSVVQGMPGSQSRRDLVYPAYNPDVSSGMAWWAVLNERT